MENDSSKQSPSGYENPSGRSSPMVKWVKLLLGLMVICGAVAISAYWLRHRPRARRRPPQREARLVRTREVKVRSHPITIHAMGTVIPASEVKLVARVSGQLTDVNSDLIPGGHLSRGEVLATVDQSDYRLAVKEAKAALRQAELTCEERELAIAQRTNQVAQAQKNLILEKAQQEVARSEYELLCQDSDSKEEQLALAENISTEPGTAVDLGDPIYGMLGGGITTSERELILRRPQINAAEAAVRAAEAGEQQARVAHKNSLAARIQAQTALEKAELNLEWSTIEAPFNAVVRVKHVGIGSYVSPGNPVITVVRNAASGSVSRIMANSALRCSFE